MIKYIIKELVKTSQTNYMATVFEINGEYERSAKLRFEELTKTFPNFYFELLKIQYIEECIKFTKIPEVSHA